MRGLAAIAQPLLLALEPERAHDAALKALRAGLYPRSDRARDPSLRTDVLGLKFPNPLGMAAGFDKNGEVPGQILDLGFGFTEVGSVTPLPQSGNPRPRVFRIPDRKGMINRLGFNNEGHDRVFERIGKLNRRGGGVLGINVGANKDASDRVTDYVVGVERFRDLADYITVNVSSPNTPGLRALQDGEDLDRLLSAVMAARGKTPIVLKVAPDLDDPQVEAIADAARRHEVDGLVVSNTTISRSEIEGDGRANETGGLSGGPLFHRSTVMLARFHQATSGRIPLIGVGGITSAQQAVDKIRAGASLVQIYTGLIYGGFNLVDDMLAAFARTVRREQVSRIGELSGCDAETWARKNPSL